MKRFNKFIVLLAILAVTAVPAGAISNMQTAPNGEGNTNRQRVDKSYALVQLKGEPLATYSKTKPPQGKKVDFNSSSVKSYRAQLSALRNDFKSWLRTNAPKARITGEFDIALNAVGVELNGTTLDTLRKSPQVASAEYEGIYYATGHAGEDPDMTIVNAMAAWSQVGGYQNAGTGIKVAILDTGIDITHPCFNDAGYPNRTRLGEQQFTNNKVIVAKVFSNQTRKFSLNADDLDDHGTHVAGIVGCNYGTEMMVEGSAISYKMSGVAPNVLLGNYKVLPGGSGRSEDILNGMEEAYEDGFDVANMSLGGGESGIQDLLSKAVNNLDAANMVIATSAGNNGPGAFTADQSPGGAEAALAAGGVTVGHNVWRTVVSGANTYRAVKGDFAEIPSDLTRPLDIVTDPAATATGGLGLACTALPAGSLANEIAVVSRGTCFFIDKVRNAYNAGAVGVIVVNNQPGDPFVMGNNSDPNVPPIPAYMIGLSDRASIMTKEGQNGTLVKVGFYEHDPAKDQITYSSSSWGPTEIDYRVKPNLVAPGENVLSSVPHHACAAPPCFAFFNGTSMASPHLAGTAAIVRQLHPTWTAAQVRSAIANTADLNEVRAHNIAGNPITNDVNRIGNGLLNVADAINAKVAIEPVNISFDAIPAGSGQSRTRAVKLTNLTNSTLPLSVSVKDVTGTGVTFTLDTASATLAPGASKVVNVTVSAVKNATPRVNGYQAWLWLQIGSTEVAHAPLFTYIK